MTASGQSQEEATAMIMGAVSVKTTTLTGFWNVRTMYEQGKMAQVIAEETLEVDWPCHPPRSLHRQDCLALDTRGKAKITWRCTVEKEMQHATRHNGHE